MANSISRREASVPNRGGPDRPLTLIRFSHFRLGIYNLAMDWAKRNGQTFKLLVTSPGPTVVRSSGYQKIIAAAPPAQDILVTTRMARLAGYLAPLKPDIMLLFGWWYRIPPDVLAVPRLGTVNIHAAALPRYRGHNSTPRAVYDGQPIGVTAHWVDPGIDTGTILYRNELAEPPPGFRFHGADRGPRFRTMLLGAGFADVWARSTLIERWAPLRPVEQALWSHALPAFAGLALQRDLPAEDLALWRELRDSAGAAAFVARPDFYIREVNVVAVG